MDAGSIVTLFLLVTLFTLWIVVSIHAHERLSRTRRLSIGRTTARDILLTLLAVPSISAVSTIKTIENLPHHLWQTLQSLDTAIRSLCKALVRCSARRWYWFSRHPAQTPQQNDLEMSRSCICDRYGQPQRLSTLLQIPAEIREIMIRMSVVHYDVLDCRPTILLRPRKQFRDAMALIRTCRQLYREGRGIVLACTLFHVWTRSPFYRQLKPAAWNELTMIHLAAQLNSQHTSRLVAAIRDLNHMASLREIYISIWDFIDFETNEMAVASVFGPLRNRLRDLSLVQVNLICPRTINHRAERRLKTLIMAKKGTWPVDQEFGLLRSLQGPVTKWRAFIKLQGYETQRAVGVDEDLVALPWDGEHV